MRTYRANRNGHAGRGVWIASGLFFALLAGLLAFSAVVNDSYSDSYYDLLVSQAVIEHGSVSLNPYIFHINAGHHSLRAVGGNIYNIYPMGSQLLSIPVVYVYLMRGYQMYDMSAIITVQRIIKTLTVVAVFITIFSIGLYYVPPPLSLAITVATFYGGPMISTLGTALWSHNFGVLMASIALLAMVRAEFGAGGPLETKTRPYVLGLVLFVAYLCRPTFAIFIAAALIWALTKNLGLFIRAALTCLALSACLVMFSLLHFSQIVPPYYMGTVFHSGGNWFRNAYGILLSPSRGLFVFSPFLVVVVIAWAAARNKAGRRWLSYSLLAWVGAHMLLLSLEEMWWGGGNYGLRRAVDVFPALAVLSFEAANRLAQGGVKASVAAALLAAFLALAVPAVWINSWQGLFNVWTSRWNQLPDLFESAVFDWRYPQFMANRERFMSRVLDYAGLSPAEWSIGLDEISGEVTVFRRAEPDADPQSR